MSDFTICVSEEANAFPFISVNIEENKSLSGFKHWSAKLHKTHQISVQEKIEKCESYGVKNKNHTSCVNVQSCDSNDVAMTWIKTTFSCSSCQHV